MPNCHGMAAFSVVAMISFAFSMAPAMPFSRGVSTSSAPRNLISLRRSIEKLSGMTRMQR